MEKLDGTRNGRVALFHHGERWRVVHLHDLAGVHDPQRQTPRIESGEFRLDRVGAADQDNLLVCTALPGGCDRSPDDIAGGVVSPHGIYGDSDHVRMLLLRG
jgi:hypothetical protein